MRSPEVPPNPQLEKLVQLRADGKLRPDHHTIVGHLEDASEVRLMVMSNAALLETRGGDLAWIPATALDRRASFTQCQPVCADLQTVLEEIHFNDAVGEVNRCLMEAALHEVRQTSQTLQLRAIEQARTGARIGPLTTTLHRFGWFLQKQTVLLKRVLAACTLSEEPRTAALQESLTMLAHAYCNAANIPGPSDNLKVILIPSGEDRVVVSPPHRDGRRTLQVFLTTGGIVFPEVDPLAMLQRRGLSNYLTGFDRTSKPTRQGAAYLQCFFHQMTVFEEQARIVPFIRGKPRRASRQTQGSVLETDYQGDPTLGDTPIQRSKALATVKKLAAFMRDKAGTSAETQWIRDYQLRAWLQSPQCGRDLQALASPVLRLPIAQENTTRRALAATIGSHD